MKVSVPVHSSSSSTVLIRMYQVNKQGHDPETCNVKGLVMGYLCIVDHHGCILSLHTDSQTLTVPSFENLRS
jgi:hypothetical protein